MNAHFKKMFVALALVLPGSFLCAQNKVFNIADYGAVADAKTINTTAIQKAIDACNGNGGGEVYVPAGTFMTGTISLKSHVNLYLEDGAVLLGSPDLKDHRSYTKEPYGTLQYGILYTENAEDVSITGFGAINGNDTSFFEWDKAKRIDQQGTSLTRQKDNFRKVESGIGDGPVVPKDRPRQMIIFSNCKNVTLRDIRILNSPFWSLHLADCDAVLIHGVKVWTHMLVPNADGMDITSCTNVRISDCDIRSGDDGIVITGFAHHYEMSGFKDLHHVSENIVITNCNVQSYSCAVRIGYEDQNDLRHVQVSNVNITNSSRGIGIFLRAEGSLEDISFSNIYIETKLHTGDWWGNAEPIHISAVPGNAGAKLGKIKNVRFNNIICNGENGMLIYGSKESTIEDVSFNGIVFQLSDTKLNDVAGGNIDLRGALHPTDQLFQRDIPGLYVHYANNVTINDFKLTWANARMPFFTHGIEADHFAGLKITNFDGGASPINKQASRIYLENGTGFTTDNMAGVKKK